MGTKVLEAHREIDEIRFSVPNEVLFAADRPYGLIEATVQCDDAVPADAAWSGTAGFC